MDIEFLSFNNQKNLIAGVVLHKLTVHRDKRGMLVELLREDWGDVLEHPKLQFGQSYCSVTLPGFARDEDRWHYHPTRQIDRFAVVKGTAVVALYDRRMHSKTRGFLNLFLMGEMTGDKDQYLLFIPKEVLHAFCAVGDEPCYLISFPTHTYDTSEEGRIPFKDIDVCFPDGTPFSWDAIRKEFNRGAQRGTF